MPFAVCVYPFQFEEVVEEDGEVEEVFPKIEEEGVEVAEDYLDIGSDIDDIPPTSPHIIAPSNFSSSKGSVVIFTGQPYR